MVTTKERLEAARATKVNDNSAPSPSLSLRLEWRDPADLNDNPKNWRTHPQEQIDSLGDVLNHVGWAGACLLNERTGRLIDGHARKKLALINGAEKIPVLIGNWSEEQEALILATLDPLAAMAQADAVKLDELLRVVPNVGSEAIDSVLADLAEASGLDYAGEGASDVTGSDDERGADIQELWSVVVHCRDEDEQRKIYEQMTGEGHKCRLLTL